ncbi:MAG: MFS transporter, partial [Microbacterium sp.]
GHLADVDLKRTLIGGLIALAIVQTLLALTAQWIWAVGLFVFATGFVASALSPTIQTRLMDVAGDNQSIAAALNHSALNIGNSVGAFLGGMVIAAGWGYVAPAWVGVLLAFGGLGLAVLSLALERRREPVLA